MTTDGWRCPGCGVCYAPSVERCPNCFGTPTQPTHGMCTCPLCVPDKPLFGCGHPPHMVSESTAGRICGLCGANLGPSLISFETTFELKAASPRSLEGLRVLGVRVE